MRNLKAIAPTDCYKTPGIVSITHQSLAFSNNPINSNHTLITCFLNINLLLKSALSINYYSLKCNCTLHTSLFSKSITQASPSRNDSVAKSNSLSISYKIECKLLHIITFAYLRRISFNWWTTFSTTYKSKVNSWFRILKSYFEPNKYRIVNYSFGEKSRRMFSIMSVKYS